MTQPNFDVFGHCVVCHKNMNITEVIDGKVTNRLSGEYREEMYYLDDGSKMRVAICMNCQKDLDNLSDDNEAMNKQIMNCVIDGWKHEVETYAHWPKEKKDAYLNRYGGLQIVTRVNKKPDDVLLSDLKKFHEKKIKEAGNKKDK